MYCAKRIAISPPEHLLSSRFSLPSTPTPSHSAADQRRPAAESTDPISYSLPSTLPTLLLLYLSTLLPYGLSQPPGPTTQDPTLCRRTIGMGVVSHSDLWSSVLRLVSTGRGSRVPLSTHRPRLTRCTVIWGHADLATHPEQEEGEGEGEGL
jgi:hypothetical protein